MLACILGYSQSKPGGTSLDVELWLQADKLQLIDSSKVETWFDQSTNGRNFSKRANDSVPLFFFDGMNYNPRLYFGDPSNTKLVGEKHFVELGKSYYVFYVSEIEGTTEYQTVFSLRTNLNGASGWRHTTAADIPWMRNGIGNQFSVTPNKKYAVNMAYFPNSNPGRNYMFTNGVKYELGSGNNLIDAAANNIPIIGVENTGTAYNFKGSISEIIVLSAPNNLAINEGEIHKINSYLAIKYGIKFNQNTPLNYIDSDGNVIWNGFNNTSYNAYVFGLARDDASGLYQKQSASYDDSSISVFLDELEYTNSANKGEITSDKSFLLLSSNGIFGDGDYSVPSGTAFANGSLNKPINKLSHEILRVNKTGTGISKFNMSFSAELYQVEYVLVSSDETFSNPGAISYYPIVNGVARDIEANDGQYIGFAFYRPDFSSSNFRAELWLDANELTLKDTESVYTWYDKSGNNRNFVQNGTNSVPTYDLQGMNFNPKLDFTAATNTKLVGQGNILEVGRAYYVFYVSRTNSTSNQGIISLMNTTSGTSGWLDDPAIPGMNSRIYYRGSNGGLPYGVNMAYYPNKTASIASLFGNGIRTDFGSSDNTLVFTTGSVSVLGNSNLTTGLPLDGYINEVVVFSTDNINPIDDNFVLRVNSYLALKYGVTLRPIDGQVTTGVNYIASDGSVVWEGILDTGYNNDIFAIARDDDSGLYQKQATSHHYNSIAVSLGNLEQSNKKNNSQITVDKNYLIFGSNGLTGGESYIQPANTTYLGGFTVPIAINERYKRTLRVSKVGNAIGAISMRLSNDLASVPYVMVSKSISFIPTATTIYPVVNGVAQGINLEHDDYIGFVLDRKTPGGVSTDVELWLKADDLLLADAADVNTWYDASINARNFVKNGTDPSPKFYTGEGMNFNPRLNLGSNAYTKLLGPINITDASKEYYVYHVSYSLNTTRASVLSFNQQLNNSYGWNGNATNTHPWLYSAADRDATLGIGKPYSINTAFSPNRQATGINAYLYVNGVKNTFANAGRVFGVSTTNRMIIGTDNLTTGHPFYGDISEIIVLSAPQGSGAPNEDDILRVNSYLALKYGLTIKSNDGSNTSNYVASDGTTVIWDATANTGYNENIFGIGRDDLSGLYQKQGTSYEDTRVTAFIGNYENLNIENTGIIAANRSFLLFGSNNGVGFEPYDYVANTDFANGQISERINVRHRFVLKAQNTGNFAPVNLSVTLGAKYVLVSKDPTFPIGQTNIHEVVDNIASNITIETGDYIGFGTYAIGPGGVVDGLEVWLSADRANIEFAGGNNVNIWKDISPFGKDYSYDAVNLRGKQYPQFIDCSPLMNFMPTVEFSSTSYLAIFGDARNPAPMSVNTPPEFTTFTAYNSTGAGSSRYYTHGFGGVIPNGSATRYPAMGFYPRNGAGRLRNDGRGDTDVNGTIAGFVRGTTALEMINTSIATASATFDYGGYEDIVGGGTGFGTGFRLAQGGTIGGASINDASFVGVISEIFFYNRTLTPTEHAAIRSYIGAKYAITIRQNQNTSAFNYTLSNGTIVWNGESTTNTPFHNNVAGLVRDDQADLHINIAKSSATGAIITMMAGDEECNGNPSLLANDFSGLFWGNNGEPINDDYKYDSNDPLICGAVTSSTKRIWLVEKTNLTEQRVTIKAGGTDFIYNGAGFQVFLLIADSPQKLANKQWDQIIPGNFVNGEHQFTYTFKDKYTYFALASKTVPGVCESCEFLGTKKIDFRRVNWPTRGEMGPKVFDLQNDFKVTVQVTQASPVLRNRFPRPGSQNTLRFDRRGNAEVLTKVNFTNYADEPVAASTTFEIYNIDRYSGYNLDDVVIKGYCGSGVVAPKLSYVYSRYPDRSSYNIITSAIQGQGLAKARGVRYSGGVGYTNQRGRMLVYFDTPVERIEISYKVDGIDNNGTKRIGIGPMEFTCIKFAPLPEPNDDGLIFTKQATQQTELCLDVNYVFQVINTNCDARTVNLYDELPAGMIWNDDSLVMNSTSVTENDINFSGSEMTINNIEIPGGGDPYIIRVSAKFDDSAAAGQYVNESQINYERVPSGPQSLASSDRFTGLPQTITTAINSIRPIKIASNLSANVGCYDVDQTIEFTLTLNNLNGISYANTSVNFDFNDEIYSLVAGSVQADGITLPTADPDELLMYEGITIPAGVSTIKFKLKVVSSTANFEIDALTSEFVDTTIAYDFYIENDDVCVGNLSDSGELILPFCTYCTQPPMNPAGIEVVKSKVGISLLPIQGNQRFEKWPRSVPNGYIVLNATKRGFVITRTTPTAIGQANWIEGMIIYDTDLNCLSLYNGSEWKCIQRKCNN